MSIAADKANELVLTVRANDVRRHFDGKTWVPGEFRDLGVLLGHFGVSGFLRRGDCEEDRTAKQLIPYVVMRHEGLIYRYTRGVAGGEGRLHHRHSIGIGGHINPCDEMQIDCPASVVRRAAFREFKEETGLQGALAVRHVSFAGMINDDSDAVGRVHLGIAFVFDLYTTDIEPREAALADGRWVTPAELWVTPNLERWSQIVVQNLFAEGGMIL
jgi:predicted NUDIX family phosphoesterase